MIHEVLPVLFGVIVISFAVLMAGKKLDKPQRATRPPLAEDGQTTRAGSAPSKNPISPPPENQPSKPMEERPIQSNVGTKAATSPPVPGLNPLNFRQVSLEDALSQDLITMTCRGAGLQKLSLILALQTAEPLVVVIAAGSIFESKDPQTQNMLVPSENRLPLIEKGNSRIERGDSRSFLVDARCMNMALDTPGYSNEFSVKKTRVSGDLDRLIRSAEFTKLSPRVEQFAIWTITDNPNPGGYTPIIENRGTNTTGIPLPPLASGAGRRQGTGTGPDEDEIFEIRRVFSSCGIEVQRYRALQSEVKAIIPMNTWAIIPMRTWTDRSGRKLEAELLEISPKVDEKERYRGIFRRPDGTTFIYAIGDLIESDVQLVKGALDKNPSLLPKTGK
ncbi:hypothetical protein [Prosthecobacter sp.]|uniref:hypothetical protein n=1 Tax=Prosthecobacter sp. TaxID=1965333 RepID=UPI0025E4143C|nr:hypothetical protein [Prosthecobacter sp.]